jgi:hypothetical protein
MSLDAGPSFWWDAFAVAPCNAKITDPAAIRKTVLELTPLNSVPASFIDLTTLRLLQYLEISISLKAAF